MSKKARITFNISAIALLIAIGAQSYTNYQIDQTLKQFPYHFRDQFTLQVDETNSDFSPAILLSALNIKITVKKPNSFIPN